MGISVSYINRNYEKQYLIIIIIYSFQLLIVDEIEVMTQ